MALPLGKLALIVGAGLVGSVLAKEDRASSVSDFFSGAFKIALKQLKADDKTTSSSKSMNDSWTRQLTMLREDEQRLLKSHIFTGNQTASGKYDVVVTVVATGCGYLWPKVCGYLWRKVRPRLIGIIHNRDDDTTGD